MKEDIHYSVKPSKGSKQQALEVIRLLQQSMPIERARMRLKIQLPSRGAQHVREKILKFLTVEEEDWIGADLELVRNLIVILFFFSHYQAFGCTGLPDRSWPLQGGGGICEGRNKR